MSEAPALPKGVTLPPTVPWEEFLAAHFDWRQGEHITLIGPTGSGKTSLALAILPMRKFVIAYGTKPTGKDDTLMKLVRREKWKLVQSVNRMPRVVELAPKIVFWPKYVTPDDENRQAWELWQSMRQAFSEGGWCLFVDETFWWQKLGLGKMLESVWTQGRSIGLSLVAGTQRPAHIPLLAYDQATHVFFWRDNDERNLKRISGMNGLNANTIRATVSTLAPHAVLYVNTRTGAMVVTKAPHRK